MLSCHQTPSHGVLQHGDPLRAGQTHSPIPVNQTVLAWRGAGGEQNLSLNLQEDKDEDST